MVGLVSKSNRIPMRKRTRIMTNSQQLADQFRGTLCDGGHRHQVIQGYEGGMKRSVWAQHYPPLMVQRLADGAAAAINC